MKNTLNTIFHGFGYLLFCIGFILCMGAAGNNDLGADLSQVLRIGLMGMSACVCGSFVAWWKI